MKVLEGHQIEKEVVGTKLFSIPQLQLHTGQKIGLIGNNGVGKTTLLKMIIGEDNEYLGNIRLLADIAYLAQVKEQEALSGGEQVLQALKVALSQGPAFLLLDEPTANLDRGNQEWLLHQLKGYRGCLLVVSHDRAFLNRLVDEIWVLENQSLLTYKGNYDQVEEIRKREREGQFHEFIEYKEKVRKLERVVQEKKVKAKKMTKKKKTVSRSDWKVNSRLGAYDGKEKALGKSAKAIEKRIESLVKVEKPQKEAWVKLETKGQLVRSAHRLLRLEEGTVWRDGNFLFSHDRFSVAFGEKIGLLGRNGSGKTSFVQQILMQKLPGYYSQDLKIAYFSQNLQELDPSKTVFENARLDSLQDRVTILNLLAMLGLRYDKAQKKVSQLSGGEMVRLFLAKVLLADANLLVLDEPTNFLDLTSILALESFLQQYPGSLILISHDEIFLKKCASTCMKIENGQLRIVDD
ncbi:ABC transporter ATP-binding protein [Streptococcus varani]|uniref:ABC transporter ATP-binding protein n=1 Tax=Streptococcus varani TaxID=1608583 RepID=A0A0E3WF43_9STRE|nr:ATP-binding cassette domain-containing protein [Streptococcus varani]CQR24833.1 ABC transporter ATP-binding protein [Streptococcus varani]